MSAKATHKICILFDDEIRIAAKAVAALRDLPDDSAEDVIAAHLGAAFDACNAALYGADHDDYVLLLGRKPTPGEQA